MAKTKTSKKQKAFSINDMHEVKLKRGVKTKSFDAAAVMRDSRLVFDALVDCLREGDSEAFKEVLRAHYDAINTSVALRQVGLSKRTFYNALSKSGNPSLETIAKMISAIARESKAS
jgi:probable addiction module antidote protein